MSNGQYVFRRGAVYLVIPVFPSILSIYFDMVSVRKWIGNFDPEERAAVA